MHSSRPRILTEKQEHELIQLTLNNTDQFKSIKMEYLLNEVENHYKKS
jgi:hypothetical protein